MKLAYVRGYWTIFQGLKPLASFANFMDAWRALYAFYAGFDAD